jgi:cephalosporin hydroxylase
MPGRLLKLDPDLIRIRGGHCFIVALPDVKSGDSEDQPAASRLRLFEDEIELGPAHTPHDTIGEKGGGRFSHWGGDLYFSASDGGSPITNGRDYTVMSDVIGLPRQDDTFPVSSLPIDVLLTMQKGIMRYTYKGIDCFKCPFDLALYQRLIWDVRPRTIIEIGTWRGGSALWFADLLTAYGIDGHVYSLDIAEQPQWTDPRISFRRGDVLRVSELLPTSWVGALPRPLLVIEDSGHFSEMTSAVLDHFAPLMRSGEYLVVEDAIVYEMQDADQYNGGPRRALQEFLDANDNFIIDTEYCNYYGLNVTWNVNGYLRRR